MNPTVDRMEKLRHQLRRIEIDDQEYYIAEGDLLIAPADFEKHVAQRFEFAPPEAFEVNDGAKTAKLIGIGQNGKLVRWAPGLVRRCRQPHAANHCDGQERGLEAIRAAVFKFHFYDRLAFWAGPLRAQIVFEAPSKGAIRNDLS